MPDFSRSPTRPRAPRCFSLRTATAVLLFRAAGEHRRAAASTALLPRPAEQDASSSSSSPSSSSPPHCSTPDGSPARQELAVRSWLALPWDVTVVLLGSHPSTLALAGRLGRRVTVEAAVDSSFTGTPFFHSMIARAQAAADSDICVLVDAEVVLLPEAVTLLTDLSRIDRDWLLVSMSRNVSSFPYNLAHSAMLEEIQAGKWAADGSDRGLVLAWNNPGRPLLAGVVPSFLYGRGAHSWWLAHEVLSSETRLVFDASSLVLGLYPEDFTAKRGAGLSSSGRLPDGSWESGVNRHLASVYGSYCHRPPGGHHHSFSMLYEVVKHSEDYMLSKVEEPSFSNFVIGREQNTHEGFGKPWNKENSCLSDHLPSYSSENPEAADAPYSLEMLLQFVTDENRSVVLGVAGASYRDMLMSWVCRLRHLRVTNFVVCALDQETYEFAVLQGLPVFRDPTSPKNVSFDDCHFGTQCFKRVTKVKSRIVLEIIRLGYNVLLSDVDVYWFRNPVKFLYSLGPATFAAQSDEFNETGPINMPRRLNSGFYYARSDSATITTMDMVVKHAAKSNSSEQPSFYDVLCGKGGVNRLGDDRCLEPSTNLTVVFLDRDKFPNGAYKGLWERHDLRLACRNLGCFIIHNNWVNGRKKKLWRQTASGLWDYDPSSRMCLQSWGEASSSFTAAEQFHASEDTES
ncbi:beta-arabinofuranosyltransferase RAY1-like [Triticum dicoccoides]|uniref:beta-arabinofuranosyltransferase RAY1-like n=1 Tax=Triticum dicoccoides TaxID=85692 RepID=UPI00188F1C70|nr:beta-arabinofuranosyltransferase RAY1-like [Triticum dicoccoides]